MAELVQKPLKAVIFRYGNSRLAKQELRAPTTTVERLEGMAGIGRRLYIHGCLHANSRCQLTMMRQAVFASWQSLQKLDLKRSSDGTLLQKMQSQTHDNTTFSSRQIR